jgi:para-aminobenzoate synthetase component 1
MSTRSCLPYTPQPLPLFAEKLTQPYAFALTGGRYTIMGWDPVELITGGEDPLKRMQTLTPEIHSDFSPCGGWYGFLGYEFAESLHTHLPPRPRDLPIPDLCMGLYDRVIVFDHEKQCAYEAEHPSLRGVSRSNLANDASLHGALIVRHCEEVPRRSNPFLSNLDHTQYQTAFNQAQAALQRGDCYQVNLAQRFTAEFEGSPWDYFLDLLQKNPAPFAAYYQLPQAAIVSCSPERFIRIDKNIIETKPIKGTCKRQADPDLDKQAAHELFHSEKNRAENLMIVDLMRNDLGKICEPGSVRVPEIFSIESYRSVHHLVSTVTGILRPEISPLEALKACFPGGSITGAPKLAAMQQIRMLEPNARHVYCGSIGYSDLSGVLDMNIAIRTAVITQGKCHIWAGGGIVLDSVWEEEYQECLDKIAPLIFI